MDGVQGAKDLVLTGVVVLPGTEINAILIDFYPKQGRYENIVVYTIANIVNCPKQHG